MDNNSIFIQNIYYMLSYAFRDINTGVYETISKERFENIHNLFAAILVKGIGKQLKQGLYRDYISFSEDLAVLHGKINFPKTVNNQLSQRKCIACDYDELSVNNYLNQIIKTTSILLIKNENVDDKYKNELKKEILFFSEVDTLDPTCINWSCIKLNKNNSSYTLLLNICQLVIEGMLLTTTDGNYKLSTFVDDQRMCRLYEKFILEYYIKEWPEIKCSASQISWALDYGIGTRLPVMQTDVMLQYDNRILIIDAKYYSKIFQSQYDVETLRNNNLNQIFTYVKNLSSTKEGAVVSGMLLYAKTNNGSQPNYAYSMSGNIISAQTLDLNTDFSKISAQLDHYATKLIEGT